MYTSVSYTVSSNRVICYSLTNVLLSMICGLGRFVFFVLLWSIVDCSSTSQSDVPAEPDGPRLRRVKRVYDELARLTSSSKDDSYVIDIGEDYEKNLKKSDKTNTSVFTGQIVSRRVASVLFMSTVIVTVMSLIYKGSTNRANSRI